MQSDSVDFTNAVVQVTDKAGGAVMPTTVTVLGNFFGSLYGIAFTPQGWTSQAGHTYVVAITGVSSKITYSVEVVSC